jgi:predicted nucleotidyltransferase
VLQRLRERARAVLARRPDVVEVRLFGSLARGDAGPGSDADLFVVLRDEGARPFPARLADLAREFGSVGIGCDVIAYTESEQRALRGRADAFARAVFEEGLSLAGRAHAP